MNPRIKLALIAVCVVVTMATTIAATHAALFGDLIKVGGVAVVVDKFGPQINDFINKMTANKDLGSEEATAVVPIISIGSGSYIGAVQVIGAKENVEKCKAVVQVEGNAIFGKSIRVKALIPVGSKTTSNIKRIFGVGVSAIVDIRI